MNIIYLTKNHQIYCLQKVNNLEVYGIQCFPKSEKPAVQNYFEKHFKDSALFFQKHRQGVEHMQTIKLLLLVRKLLVPLPCKFVKM